MQVLILISTRVSKMLIVQINATPVYSASKHTKDLLEVKFYDGRTLLNKHDLSLKIDLQNKKYKNEK